MKILFCSSDNNTSSGAFLCMVSLCKFLQVKYNVEVIVVLPRNGDGESLLKRNGIKYVKINSYNWYISYRNNNNAYKKTKNTIKQLLNIISIIRIAVLSKKFQANIVVNNTTWTYCGAFVAKGLNIPLVWHFREIMELQQSGTYVLGRDFAKKLFLWSDKIIPVSKFVSDYYKREFNDLSNIMQFVYDGIDIAGYYRPKKKIFEFYGQRKINIIMVGGLKEDKGQKELVEAISVCNEKLDFSLEVLIVGEGNTEYTELLKNRISDLGIVNVKLLGKRMDIPLLLENSDIAIICSGNEPFGRVTVEAMLSGCLVIGARAGATVELIKDGTTGILYEYGNSMDLAHKIISCIKDEASSREIATAGRKEAFSLFDSERNADSIYEIYKKVAECKYNS